ncbi:hypothetical protein PSTG_02519 [Puccinia striiformis f. sp. tritici PST-78]|uniref:CNH domain-containing protein n=1 Tax=Puccinia striiformis f. sp. tritici PST-78 TaxID=1165861 RepID=A0A0L0VY26_9BASI|nr:hypothetical protein PSTG_02519 [Puccinia striiformis f. sp. tritici PST-78]
MFCPFEHSVLISRLSDTINSRPTSLLAAAHQQQLLIGTQDGSVYIYDQELALNRSSINLVPAQIDSLKILRENNSLLILAAGNIAIYDLNSFKLISNTNRWTKSNASTSSLSTEILPQNIIDPTAEAATETPILLSILAVPCKRKLMLFAWMDSEWIEPKEISLPHQIRSLTFPTPLTLFLGYSTGDYATIKISISSSTINHQISDPFPSPISTLTKNDTPSSPPPKTGGTLSSLAFKTVSLGTLTGTAKVAKNSVYKLGGNRNEIVGIKDQIACFLDQNGKLTRPMTSKSKSIPSSIIYPHPPLETIIKDPYIISILPNTNNHSTCVYVHSIPTLSHLQTLHFPDSSSSLPAPAPLPLPPKKTSSIEPPSSTRSLLTSSSSDTVYLIGQTWDQSLHTTTFHLESLILKPWTIQIDELIDLGQYEEALQILSALTPTQIANKDQLSLRLKGLIGLHQFIEHKFDQAIDVFIQLNVNPAKIIGLFPPIISGLTLGRRREEWEASFGGRSVEAYLRSIHPLGSEVTANNHDDDDDLDRRSTLSALTTKPTIDDDVHFKASVEVLIRYLTDRRQHVNRAFLALNSTTSTSTTTISTTTTTTTEKEEEGEEEDSKKKRNQHEDRPISEIDNIEELIEIAQVIDTTLFKSYLALRPTMLGPLCRLPNWCQVDQVESLLMDAKRYLELLDLYRGKGLHDKALKLLKKMAMNEEDLIEQIHPTIRYLQKLGSAHFNLILDSSKWIFTLCQEQEESEEKLQENSNLSLKLIENSLEIFMADLSAVDSLPKREIVNFLDSSFLKSYSSTTPLRLYLEFLVTSYRHPYSGLTEQDLYFVHEKLITVYIREINRLRGMNKPDRAQSMYNKLLEHLQDSRYYSSNWVLGRLPPNDMYEARALSLAKIGHHHTALKIYVFQLHDLLKAEEYCKRVYENSIKKDKKTLPESPSNKNDGKDDDGSIFLCLLKICLRPISDLTPPSITHSTIPISSSSEEEEDVNHNDHHHNQNEIEKGQGIEEGTNEPLKTEDLLEFSIRFINSYGHKIGDLNSLIELIPPLVPLSKLTQFFKKSILSSSSSSSFGGFIDDEEGGGEKKQQDLGLSKNHQRILVHLSTNRLAFLGLASNSLGQRRVKIDLKRLCIGCGKRLGNSVIAVHPPYGEVTHYQCQERFLDPHLRRL